MGKNEITAEKRMFTTVNIYSKIVEKLNELSGIQWEVQQYNYLYVTHKILSHINIFKSDTLGCKINIQYLAKLFGKSNSDTATILRNLAKWNIIYKSIPAAKGISARYLLYHEYTDEKQFMISVSSTDAPFINKIIKYKSEEIKDNFLVESYKLLESSLSLNNEGYSYLNNKYNLSYLNDNSLLLDGVANLKRSFLASKAEILRFKNDKKNNGGYGIERRDIPLFLIYIKEFNLTRPLDKNGNVSRVYSSITNLPREHRSYLNLCGKPMLMTDISNSQILLTVPMIEKHYKVFSGKGSVDMPKDIIKFRQWAESGEFYEKFSELLTPDKMSDEQRTYLKKMVFRVLWFGKDNRFINTNRVKSLFIKHFPNVYSIMKALKIKDHAQFSIELQRFEASIIVDKVAKKMLKKYPILTLHDAIVCNSDDALQDAENRIAKELAKYNITPKFKRENEKKCVSSVQPIINSNLDSVDNQIKVKNVMREIRPLEKKYLIK